MCRMILRNLIFIFLLLITTNVYALEKCQWNNKKGIPCLTVTKTPNTSLYSSKGVNKIIITKPIDLPPDLLPPGKNLLILFWISLIIASMSGGVGPLPEPFPPPPGGLPHGLPPRPWKLSDIWQTI